MNKVNEPILATSITKKNIIKIKQSIAENKLSISIIILNVLFIWFAYISKINLGRNIKKIHYEKI